MTSITHTRTNDRFRKQTGEAFQIIERKRSGWWLVGLAAAIVAVALWGLGR